MIKKLILLLLPLVIIVTGCGEKAVETTPVGNHYCSLVQGFELWPSRQDRVGYITYLKIGSVEGTADFLVTDPMNPTAKMKVFGVVSWLTWRGTPDDPVVFAAQVSAANEEKLVALGKTNLTDIPIEFSFALYDYDLKSRAYYKSLSSGTEILKGTLFKQGEYFLFLISTDTGVDVPNPKNFNFQLGVKPADMGQKIYSVEDWKIIENPWGGE